MGGCLGSQKRNQGDTAFDREPTDTLTLTQEHFPNVSFKALLSKIKVKSCGVYKYLGLRINFGGFEEFQVKGKMIVNQTARWDISHTLSFVTNNYQLRKRFLQISVMDSQKIVGYLKINLFLLATGPYHQDFNICMNQAEDARVSFNLKIAQEVKVSLQILSAEMIPNDKQFPGDSFAFNFRSIMGQKVQQSQLSYNYVISLNSDTSDTETQKNQKKILKRASTLPDKYPNQILLQKTLSHHPKSQIQRILWQKQVGKMPILQNKIYLYDLHGASFNIVFYSCGHTRQYSSQCFLSYSKISRQTFTTRIDSNTKIQYQERNLSVNLKTWDHGKETGQAIFTIRLSVQKHIKQMQVCVRTQKGILESSPVFSKIGGGRVPQQLVNLQKLGNQMQNIYLQASRKGAGAVWINQIVKRLKTQKQILRSSAKQSKLMFVYPDEAGLLKAQRGMVQLGHRLKQLIKQDHEQLNPMCWQVLIALIKRGEMTLSYVGFNPKQLSECISGKCSQFLSRKKDVALSYQKLMIDLLELTLKSLQTYSSESQKQFAQLFCAYAYFRVPKFRQSVLSVIKRPTDQVEQWRGTDYSLTEKPRVQSQSQTTFSLMFDWQNNFYKAIQKQQLYFVREQALRKLLQKNQWEQRMKKRGGAFFAFVRFWVNYVQGIAVNSKHISWQHFPGYQTILKSFLVEMKTRKVQQYSQAMKKAATSLLSNDKLLNPFVLIVFKKTNGNEQMAVYKALDFVGLLFSSLAARGRSISTSFDFKIFIKAFKLAIEGDSAFSTGKAILVFYDHFSLFPIQIRLQISMFLMTKVFFKLFLHWSANVRAIFHHLFYIRMYHEASRPLQQLDPKDHQIYQANPQYRSEVLFRYRKLLLILQNTQAYQHKLAPKITNDQQLYKRIRIKIQAKRKQVQSLQPLQNNRRKFSNDQNFQKQLMQQLAQPKLQRYSSQVLNNNLKKVVQNSKTTVKEQVIVRKGAELTQKYISEGRKRKLPFFEIPLQQQLVPLKQQNIKYVRSALEQYNKIGQHFIKHVQKNKDSVPVVRLQFSIDQKQLRPEGLSQHDQW